MMLRDDDNEHLIEIDKKDKLKSVEDFEVILIGAPVSVYTGKRKYKRASHIKNYRYINRWLWAKPLKINEYGRLRHEKKEVESDWKWI